MKVLAVSLGIGIHIDHFLIILDENIYVEATSNEKQRSGSVVKSAWF